MIGIPKTVKVFGRKSRRSCHNAAYLRWFCLCQVWRKFSYLKKCNCFLFHCFPWSHGDGVLQCKAMSLYQW